MTLAASCDGAGECPEAETHRCEPYVCDADRCRTTCRDDDDCVEGSCDGERCVRDALCIDDETLEQGDGSLVKCAPYRCVEDRCLASCSSVLDCVAAMICNADGVCVAPSSGAVADEEGGCSVVGRGTSRGRGLLNFVTPLLPLCWLARRRRLRRRSAAVPLAACR
jgi:hypothetical protein